MEERTKLFFFFYFFSLNAMLKKSRNCFRKRIIMERSDKVFIMVESILEHINSEGMNGE